MQPQGGDQGAGGIDGAPLRQDGEHQAVGQRQHGRRAQHQEQPGGFAPTCELGDQPEPLGQQPGARRQLLGGVGVGTLGPRQFLRVVERAGLLDALKRLGQPGRGQGGMPGRHTGNPALGVTDRTKTPPGRAFV